jgi:cystathionine beta-synthase
VVARAVETGQVTYEGGSWLVEGIGEDFIPPNLDLSVIDDGVVVSDAEAFAAVNELLRTEGILGGSSTGTLLAGALKWCRQQTEPKTVVTFVCDTGNKYPAKAFDQAWLVEQGLTERETSGDLRDLIMYRADQGRVISVGPQDTVNTAYNRMRANEVSQVPVIQDGRPVGILDEEDILLAVYDRPQVFREPVSRHMTGQLDVIAVDRPVDDVLALFRRNEVAMVMDGDTFLGMITRVDLINHIRRSVG